MFRVTQPPQFCLVSSVACTSSTAQGAESASLAQMRGASASGASAFVSCDSGTGASATSNQSGYFVRPFEMNQYGDISAIHNRLSPLLSLSPSEMAFADATRDSRCLLNRWVASLDGQTAGFAELTQSSEAYSPLRFQFRICVLPEQAGHGLEEELLSTVVAAFQGHHGTGLRCLLRSGQETVEEALKKFGFASSMRFSDRLLDLHSMDAATVDKVASIPPTRIDFTTLSDILFRPDGHRAIFNLENRVKSDIPYPDDLSMKFEYFAKAILGNPGLMTDGSFVAMDGDHLVGLCYLLRREDNPTAIIRLTGVLPTYRGIGIASHLKALMIHYARNAGFSSLFTRAEEGNGSINRLNEKLGFKAVGTCVNWSRTF